MDEYKRFEDPPCVDFRWTAMDRCDENGRRLWLADTAEMLDQRPDGKLIKLT